MFEMYLRRDTNQTNPGATPFATPNINLNILKKIENDLDCSEKIWMIFLMTKNYMTTFDMVLRFYENYATNPYIISEFVTRNNEKWVDKFLEALCIIKNREIIRKLGLSFSELEKLYNPKERLFSVHVSLIGKFLFTLCNELAEDETESLINDIVQDIGSYEPRLKKIKLLEIHILYWFKCNYISVSTDGRINFQNVLKHLTKFNFLDEIRADFEQYEGIHNMQSISQGLSSIDCRGLTSKNSSDIKTIHKGMCVIINQKKFAGQEYPERHGTDTDRDNLKNTFENFGFKIHIYENLKMMEFLNKIESIPKDFGCDYECLFLCILSHGCRGGIITSDEREVLIESIEDKLCCPQLENVYKICIIQACQGKVTGRMKSPLASDGGRNILRTDEQYTQDMSDISGYKNYCLFLSTMQRFVSIRHLKDGSWFIQELCQVLKEYGCEIGFVECTQKVIHSVQEKRGNIDGGLLAAQVPELRTRLTTNFKFSRSLTNT